MTKRQPTIAIDFDWTLWDPTNNRLLPGALEAVNRLREKGCKVWVFSCNRPVWIRYCLDDAGLVVDGIWEGRGKIVADLYCDDCGFHFAGDWQEALPHILDRLKQRNPMIEGDTE